MDEEKKEYYEERIRGLEEELMECQKELRRLTESNEWMHETIWDLMRKLKAVTVEKDGENAKKDWTND